MLGDVLAARHNADAFRQDASQQRESALQYLFGAMTPDRALDDGDAAIAALGTALSERIRLQSIQRAQALDLEERRALVYLNGSIDGKNEAQRAAQLAIALRSDADYQRARADAEQIETDLAQANAAIEMAQKRIEASRMRLRIFASGLDLLAGG